MLEVHTHQQNRLECGVFIHVFQGWSNRPFCQCGDRRNPIYRRTLWQKLRGLPKRPD